MCSPRSSLPPCVAPSDVARRRVALGDWNVHIFSCRSIDGFLEPKNGGGVARECGRTLNPERTDAVHIDTVKPCRYRGTETVAAATYTRSIFSTMMPLTCSTSPFTFASLSPPAPFEKYVICLFNTGPKSLFIEYAIAFDARVACTACIPFRVGRWKQRGAMTAMTARCQQKSTQHEPQRAEHNYVDDDGGHEANFSRQAADSLAHFAGRVWSSLALTNDSKSFWIAIKNANGMRRPNASSPMHK